MGARIDLRGRKFHRLTVLEERGRDSWGQVLWLCECDCGKTVVVVSGNLRNGVSKSCGCWNLNSLSGRAKHNLSKSGTYRTWKHMMARCYNKKDARYKYYGGRGVSICERWQDFVAFYEDMGDKPDGYSIERIDNNGNYEPSNCEWATIAEQNRNNRRTVKIEYDGQTRCMSEWARLLGVPKMTFSYRIKTKPLDAAFKMSGYNNGTTVTPS
jgi:hypothetical protein